MELFNMKPHRLPFMFDLPIAFYKNKTNRKIQSTLIMIS